MINECKLYSVCEENIVETVETMYYSLLHIHTYGGVCGVGGVASQRRAAS